MTKKIVLLVCFALTVTVVSLSAAPSFQQICNNLVQENKGSSVVKGIDGWLFLKEELQHVGAGKFWGENAKTASRARNKAYADPIKPILAYQKQLAGKGITLYFMPVPPKVLVYPDKLAAGISMDEVKQDQKLYNDFYSVLEKGGVKVIDLLPTLLERRAKENVYCKTDTHFSGEGLALFAEAAAKAIQQEKWYSTVAKEEFSQSTEKIAISGDLSRMAGGRIVKETLALNVIRERKSGKLIVSDKKSPVILLGDSHTLVFSAGGDLHAKGAGLFDQLSARLGFAVDLLGVRGSGVTPARIKLFQRSKKDSEYLEGKKALIWCFTARDFTGTGGWKNIPVAPGS